MQLRTPPGWHLTDGKLGRTFAFADFPAAIAFMVELSFRCHAADHHPRWTNVYDRVHVELVTHDTGSVTEKDVALAEAMNATFARSARPA